MFSPSVGLNSRYPSFDVGDATRREYGFGMSGESGAGPSEQLIHKSLVVYGGGDPDRTGDPRLMSPLLCQLSYTATRLEDQQKNEGNNTREEPNLSTRPTVNSGKA